jgi:hypothetical protein
LVFAVAVTVTDEPAARYQEPDGLVVPPAVGVLLTVSVWLVTVGGAVGFLSLSHSSLSGISVQSQRSGAKAQSDKMDIFDMCFFMSAIFFSLEKYLDRYPYIMHGMKHS